jgi:hypothetical protein
MRVGGRDSQLAKANDPLQWAKSIAIIKIINKLKHFYNLVVLGGFTPTKGKRWIRSNKRYNGHTGPE